MIFAISSGMSTSINTSRITSNGASSDCFLYSRIDLKSVLFIYHHVLLFNFQISLKPNFSYYTKSSLLKSTTFLCPFGHIFNIAPSFFSQKNALLQGHFFAFVCISDFLRSGSMRKADISKLSYRHDSHQRICNKTFFIIHQFIRIDDCLHHAEF